MKSEIFAALLGVLAGFLLNEWAALRRRRRERAEAREAVLTVLRIEIERNREALRRRVPGKRPTQSNQIWESQLPILSTVLAGDEIRSTHDFYYELFGLRKSYELHDQQKLGLDELERTIDAFLQRPAPLGP